MYLIKYPNIEAERVRHSLKRTDLCKVLEVSERTIRNWLEGKTAIPSDKLVKMSKLWNVSVDYLLGLSD